MDLSVLVLLLQLWVAASAALSHASSRGNPASLGMWSQDRNRTSLFNSTGLGFESTIVNVSYQNLPDPYDDVLAEGRLTIRFFDYHGMVDDADLTSCVRNANDYVNKEIAAGHEDIPLDPDLYLWSAGNVNLYLVPSGSLTWARWSLVPSEILRVVESNSLQGTQFVLSWRDVGPVGHGRLTATSGRNVSEPTSSATSVHAFPNVYDLPFLNLGVIEFYHYRGSISSTALRRCVQAAARDAMEAMGRGDMAMSAPYYSWTSDNVVLYLKPDEGMKWHMWGVIPAHIHWFVKENNFRGTDFKLLWNGVGIIGYGHFVNESTNAVAAF